MKLIFLLWEYVTDKFKMKKKNCLIFFLKFPEKGKVKTRLALATGKTNALELYRCFIADILAVITQIQADIVVFFTPIEKQDEIKKLLGPNYAFFPQTGNDIGERMANSFKETFELGYDNVILIGSDIPQINRNIIENGFESLNSDNITLGPCPDGGYYLIGFARKKFHSNIFDGIMWSTDSVLSDTIRKIYKNGDKYHLLTELTDIDSFEDLGEFYLNEENKKLKTYKYIKNMRLLK